MIWIEDFRDLGIGGLKDKEKMTIERPASSVER